MRKLILLLFIAGLAIACNPSGEKDQAAQVPAPARPGTVKDGVFIHLSSGYENAHKVLMALKMAVMMSDDKDVLVYLDIEAVKLVLKDAADLTHADFPPMKEMLKQLTDKGVPLMACPTCLKAAGKSPGDLMTGVMLADKEKFFNFTQGRIVTMDY